MKPQISGSFGPSVVVTSGNKRMINIAGGCSSGDVYREVDSAAEDPFMQVRAVLDRQKLTDEDKKWIRQIVDKAEQEVARGPDANVGVMDLILHRLKSTSPAVAQSLAQTIAQRTDSSAVRMLSLQVLSSLAA